METARDIMVLLVFGFECCLYATGAACLYMLYRRLATGWSFKRGYLEQQLHILASFVDKHPITADKIGASKLVQELVKEIGASK